MGEQVILPRYDGGSDWGSRRRVIARSATHCLYIWPGSFYSDNGGRHYSCAKLQLATKDRWSGGRWAIGDTLVNGGRITNRSLREHAAKIDAAFGEGVTARLDVRTTTELANP